MLRYLKERLTERSTWMNIGSAIYMAASMSTPWCFIGLAAGVGMALVPDGALFRTKPKDPPQ